MHDVAPLESKASCQVIVLPLTCRVGRIREVATKLHDKPTERATDYYRRQVREGLLAQLHRINVPAEQQDEMVNRFWAAVELEQARLKCRGSRPGGDSA